MSPDPAYQQHVPSLDGGEEASEHILFGTDVDLENDTDGGQHKSEYTAHVHLF